MYLGYSLFDYLWTKLTYVFSMYVYFVNRHVDRKWMEGGFDQH